MSEEISDFFGAYPLIEDPLFNTWISKKQEFAELKPSLSEPTPIRGQGFKHQEMAVRYLTWYHRLFLIHDPGTGKSCIITHSSELFKREYLKDPEDPTKIRRAVILVKGPPLRDNIKNEIACKCTPPGTYETEKVLQAIDEVVQKGNITRELHTWYDIFTYKEFATEILKRPRLEDLEEYMSNKAFYVDEAHNVPTLADIRSARPTGDEDEESVYNTIHRAFHMGKRNKIILASATPMKNSPIDIIPTFNMILPMEMQMERVTLDKEEEFSNRPLEYFEPYFRGRVSYIRALVTGAQELPQGLHPQVGDDERIAYTTVYAAGMSPFQYQVYLQAVSNDTRGGKGRKMAIYDNPRQSSNFVYPDGSYGSNGFEKYLEKIKDRYQIKQNPDGQRLLELISTNEGLKLLAAKFSEMTEICKDAYPIISSFHTSNPTFYPDPQASLRLLQENYPQIFALRGQFPGAEMIMDDSRGIIFVYFPDYVHGSGAIMFGKCLEAHGYEEFRETKSIFLATSESGRNFGPCRSYAESQVERPSSKPKRPRYAILSGSDVTPGPLRTTIDRTVNSYENRYGEYLHVIIGSKSAREGISINNASRRIMGSSSWHYSANFQANERIFRSTSHIYRLAEKRKLLQQASLNDENVIFNVLTYNMVAVYDGNPDSPNPQLQAPNYSTIDVEMFVKAEQKDRLNRRVMRYLKQSSYDCHINYERNVRPTDRDGTPTCDYTTCRYTCAGIRSELLEPLDRSTKILYYSTTEVQRAMNAVTRIFSRFYSLTLEKIHQLIHSVDKTMDPLFIDMAVERMIRDNVRLLDRMGFFGYLRESDSGVIYLEKDPFETRDRPEDTAYSSVLIGTQDPNNNSFYDYAVGVQLIAEAPLVEALKLAGPTDPEFNSELNQLSVFSKAFLLEEAYNRRVFERVDSDLIEGIISAFQNSIYITREPRDLLRKVKWSEEHRGQGRGRKRDPNKQPKSQRLGASGSNPLPSYDPTDLGEEIYLHTIYNQASHDRTNYSAVNRWLKADGMIRILNPKEKIGWRNVENHEFIVYNNIIKQGITAIQNQYERFPIYGIMIPPKNQLHIRDRESENSSQVPTNRRLINEGKVCNNWNKPDLVDILYRLGIRYPPTTVPFNRQDVIEYLYKTRPPVPVAVGLNTFDDEKLLHYFYWYQNNSTRDIICEYLKEFFSRNGMLFTGKVIQTVPNPVSVGSINPGPDPTTIDYDQPFEIPSTTTVPTIPSQIMPQFASSAPGQPPPQPLNVIQTILPAESELTQPLPQSSHANVLSQMMQ